MDYETINLKKQILSPYFLNPYKRGVFIDEFIRSSVIDDNSTTAPKLEIYDFFTKNNPSQEVFRDYLYQLYTQNGYKLIKREGNPPEAYKPYVILYNKAGMQFSFNDRNGVIHPECIGWNEVARRVAKMIKSNEYLSEKPLNELRKNRDRGER